MKKLSYILSALLIAGSSAFFSSCGENKDFWGPHTLTVVITGSAAVNKTMPRLLELAKNARVVLTGPSVTLCPGLMELGIDRLYGLAITEGEEMLRSIVEKRGSVNRFGRRFCLER